MLVLISTGLRGKIQVSQSTAQLLEASGKGTWLTKREEKVIAKGKGHLQTWWVNPANQKGSSSASGGSDKISASESNATSHVEEVMPKSVNPRLVSWIVELLLDDIKKLVHHRQLCGVKGFSSSLVYHRPEGSSLIDEVQDKIQMPRFDAKSADLLETHYQDISLGDKIEAELRQYVTTIAGMYRDNNFHNFERKFACILGAC